MPLMSTLGAFSQSYARGGEPIGGYNFAEWFGNTSGLGSNITDILENNGILLVISGGSLLQMDRNKVVIKQISMSTVSFLKIFSYGGYYYLVGNSTVSTVSEPLIAKYDTDFNLIAQHKLVGFPKLSLVTQDTSGNFYFVSVTDFSSSNPADFYPSIAKVDIDGNLVWRNDLTTGTVLNPSYNETIDFSGMTITGLAVDSSSNLYIAGQVLTYNHNESQHNGRVSGVIKLNSNGTVAWQNYYIVGSVSGSYDDFFDPQFCNDCLVDSNNNLFVIGHTNYQQGVYVSPKVASGYLIKINSSGTLISHIDIGGDSGTQSSTFWWKLSKVGSEIYLTGLKDSIPLIANITDNGTTYTFNWAHGWTPVNPEISASVPTIESGRVKYMMGKLFFYGGRTTVNSNAKNALISSLPLSGTNPGGKTSWTITGPGAYTIGVTYTTTVVLTEHPYTTGTNIWSNWTRQPMSFTVTSSSVGTNTTTSYTSTISLSPTINGYYKKLD